MPQPDGVDKAATGRGASIRTPGQALYLLRMARKLLAQAASFSQLPQLDAVIPARARQPAAVGTKGQSAHPTVMPRQGPVSAGSAVPPHPPPPHPAGLVPTRHPPA